MTRPVARRDVEQAKQPQQRSTGETFALDASDGRFIPLAVFAIADTQRSLTVERDAEGFSPIAISLLALAALSLDAAIG